MAKDTALVAALTLMSRLTGFLRVVTIAAVLGVNRFSDLYQSLNLLPNYTHELLTGTLITAMLVPPLVRHLDVGDRVAMAEIAGGFLSIVAGAALVVVGLVIAFGFLVVRLMTLGVSDPVEQSELLRLGWPLLALLMPQVIFYATAATGAAVQNASGRFALPALAPIVENLMIIAVLVIWSGLFGVGIDSIAGVKTSHAVFLGLGTTSAVFFHAALQWIGAARCGVKLFPRAGWRHPEVREIVRLALPSAGYTALNTSRLLLFLVAAGLVTGGQTVFLIALNFFYLPVALTSRPLATTALPVLARLKDDHEGFVARYFTTAGIMLFVAVPAAGLMSGLAEPVATLGLWGSASRDGAVVLLTAAIATIALAVPGESLFVLSTSASYARGNASDPLRAMALRLLITAVSIGAIAASSLAGWKVLAALGLTMAVADASSATFLARRIADSTHGLLKTVAPHIAAGLGILTIAIVVATATESWVGMGRLAALGAIAVAGAAALGVLLTLAHQVEGNPAAAFIRGPIGGAR